MWNGVIDRLHVGRYRGVYTLSVGGAGDVKGKDENDKEGEIPGDENCQSNKDSVAHPIAVVEKEGTGQEEGDHHVERKHRGGHDERERVKGVVYSGGC